MYSAVGNYVVVDRDEAERLFIALGCVNVKNWDSDVVVQRLKRIALLCDDSVDVGEHKELLAAILAIGPGGSIVLRNNTAPVAPPVSAIDRKYSSGSRGKSVRRKKQKRGALFSFTKCGIPVGAVLKLKRDPTIQCTVIGDPWVVDFGDGVMEPFTIRTKKLLGAKETTYMSPMNYWMYEGKLLRHYYKNIQCKNNKSTNKKT